MPLLIGRANDLQKHHFQVVAVTLRVAESKVMASVEVDQHCSVGNEVIHNVVEMQITVRPSPPEMAAWNLVDAPEFASRGDERVDTRFVPMEQLPQTDAANFRNDHGRARTCFHGRPLGIQQSGAMDFPGHPLVGSGKHADSTARQCQEPISERNDDTPTGSAPLDEYGHAILNAPLNSIHANAVHQPCNESLRFINHEMRPNESTAEEHADTTNDS